MTIYFPGGLVAIFIVLYFFYSVNRSNKLRRQDRQDKLAERQEELLRVLRNKKKKIEQNESDQLPKDTTTNKNL